LETFIGRVGIRDNNIRKIYSINKIIIIKRDFIIIINIKKKNFIIEFGYNNISSIKKEIKYYKKDYNILIIIIIIKFSR